MLSSSKRLDIPNQGAPKGVFAKIPPTQNSLQTGGFSDVSRMKDSYVPWDHLVCKKSSAVWDITPCSPVKVTWRFGVKYRIHQGRRASQVNN
jgi:hypothetical protein